VIDHPKAEELAAAVARWIGQIRPSLDPRNAFLARVAANALATVAREFALGPAAELAAAERIAAVLGHDGVHADLTTELCERLRTGELGVQTPGLMAALRANVLEQLAIDQPNYRHEGPPLPA
jgi:hypothetical protein